MRTRTWIFMLLLLPAACLADWYIVDPGGGGDFTSIQDAVDGTVDNDIIEVRAGVYHEHVVIPYPGKGLHFYGEDPRTTIIDAGDTDKCFYLHTQSGCLGEIAGFTLRYSGSGSSDGMSNGAIALRGDGSGNWLIFNCIFENNPYHCVISSVGATVTGCLFEGNQSSAVFIFGSAVGAVLYNTFIDCDTGVYVAGDATGAQIYNNLFYDLHVRGIWSDNPVTLLDCNDMWMVATPYVGCSPGAHGMAVDPQFCGNPPDGNYMLQSDSPLAEDNNYDCGQVGAYDEGCDESSAQGVDWGSVKALY